METKAATSPEFARFDALVGRVLSVPTAEIQKRIAADKRKPNKRISNKKATSDG
jgi:hypothetical protein